MSETVCLVANTLGYVGGGGHRWVPLNWALGLRAIGSEVLWLETIPPDLVGGELKRCEDALRLDLERNGLAGSLLLYHERDEKHSEEMLEALDRPLDLLLTLAYYAPPALRKIAHCTALLDLDPGLTQLWIRDGYLEVSGYDRYFLIGEGARRRGGLPDCGIEWRPSAPCVHVAAWPLADADPGAPYTTVSQWWLSPDDRYIELNGQWIENNKRAAFEPFLKLPEETGVPLELALDTVGSSEEERLRSLGWRVRDAATAISTAATYASYIRSSRGEFSCAKPGYTRLLPGWVSDRTLCYLASGKPAVVQYSGELGLPPDACGLLQFRNPQEAAEALLEVEANYQRYSRGARALAEDRFDAPRVAGALLEDAL